VPLLAAATGVPPVLIEAIDVALPPGHPACHFYAGPSKHPAIVGPYRLMPNPL